MAAPIEVFWVSGSPYAWRVLLALELKRLEYASRLLESSRGELKTPEFLKLNPRGKVPVMKDGDFVLSKSLAIVDYLDYKYPQVPLFGRTARERARIWRLVSECVSYLHGPANRVIAPIYAGKAADRADDIRAAAAETHSELERLERELNGNAWLGGEVVCAADIAIYPFIASLLRAASKEAAAPLELGLLPLDARYPALAAWTRRFEQLPGYDRTYPPHWRP